MPGTKNKKPKELPAGGMDRKVKILFAAIIAYAILYSIVFAQGVSYFGDDNSYSQMAYYASIGTFAQNTNNILSIRPLQIYPIAFFYVLFGINIYSLSAWDSICFVMTTAIVFYLGKELYNEYAGLLASFLFAFFPAVAALSSTMTDNIPMMFFVTLAMLALLYGQRRSSRLWYFICGASLLAGILTIPLASLAIAIVALYLIIEFIRGKARLSKTILFLGYGFAFAVVVLGIFNYVNCGNPLITFTENYNFFQTQYNQPYGLAYNPDTSNLKFYIINMFPYDIINTFHQGFSSSNYNPVSIFMQSYNDHILNNAGFYFYLVLPAIAYLLLKRERRAYFVLFWFIIGFLLLEFDPAHISLSPFSYFLQHRLSRYLMLIAPATAIILSIAIVNIAESGKRSSHRRYLGWAFALCAVVFLVFTSIPVNLESYSLTAYETHTQIEVASHMSQFPNTTKLYLSSGMFVSTYMQFNNISRFISYDQIANCSKIPSGSYVAMPVNVTIGNLDYIPNPQSYCASWQLVYTPPESQPSDRLVSGNGAIDQLKLYFVPPNSTS